MKTIFLYLLQSITVSGIFYCYYHFFLRNKKFHTYNRYFLLCALMISIVVPLLNIPVYFTEETVSPSPLIKTLTIVSSGGFEENIQNQSPLTTTHSLLTRSNILWSIYFIGFSFMLSAFITGITRILKLKRKYPVEKIDDIDFVNTNEPGTPYSFFKNLFWNQKIELNSGNGQQIFRHELYHIRQKHSADILFAEIITVIFWINPFFFLLKKEIKAIHEFLADSFAANKNEEWDYAELLLMQVLGSPNRLTNHFFHNQIKRRIAMITTSKNPSYQYLRKLFVLPVAIMITALFAFKYKARERSFSLNDPLAPPITVVVDAGHGDSDPGVIAGDGTRECDLTLQLAQKIKLLNKNDRIHVVLTRNSKETVDLATRSNIANAQKPDLFISLHVSAADNPADQQHNSGFEVYISKKNTSYLAENKILGGILLNYFMNLYQTTNKIQQRDMGIWVLDNSKCPSALVECGYMTNASDLAFVKNPANQDKIAGEILKSIEQFSLQKSSPDFNEKKKQVADTTLPDIKLNKSSTGKISATVDGVTVSSIMIDKKIGAAGFILEDRRMTVINQEHMHLLEVKYGQLWYEFVNDYAASQEGVKRLENKNAKKDGSGVSDPTFPGGEYAWIEYLQKNLNANTPVDHNAPGGTYTVWVEFKVAEDGTVSNVRSLTDNGFGMEEEVKKLFTNGQKWLPALKNGHKVSAYKKQPVTFVVQEEMTMTKMQ